MSVIAEVVPHPWFVELMYVATYIDAYTWLACVPSTCTRPRPLLLEYRGNVPSWYAHPLDAPPSSVATAASWSPFADVEGQTDIFVGTEGGGAWQGVMSW